MTTLPFNSAPQRGISAIPLAGLAPVNNYALQNFTFAFQNGDHHIQEIRLLKGAGRINAAFKDRNNDDPWTLTGCYVDVPGIPDMVNFQLQKSGVARVPIPGMNAHNRFALSGFQFNLGGSEQHIKSITILPNEAAGSVLVGFKDKDAGQTVAGILQFVLVPSNQVWGDYRRSGDNMYSGNNRTMEDPTVGAPENRVLSGFSFVYLYRTDPTSGGDAHLQRLGVDLARHTVAFQDNDRHEIIQWSVDYFALR
jgi:hypothetical protein